MLQVADKILNGNSHTAGNVPDQGIKKPMHVEGRRRLEGILEFLLRRWTGRRAQPSFPRASNPPVCDVPQTDELHKLKRGGQQDEFVQEGYFFCSTQDIQSLITQASMAKPVLKIWVPCTCARGGTGPSRQTPAL